MAAHPALRGEGCMRNSFLIILSILILSGCLTAELIAVAEKEHLEAERLSEADMQCADHKVYAHTLQYDACIAKALGTNKKTTASNTESIETNRFSNEKIINNINALPSTASGLSYPEILCDKYGYPANAPERNICLENAGGHPEPVAIRRN